MSAFDKIILSIFNRSSVSASSVAEMQADHTPTASVGTGFSPLVSAHYGLGLWLECPWSSLDPRGWEQTACSDFQVRHVSLAMHTHTRRHAICLTPRALPVCKRKFSHLHAGVLLRGRVWILALDRSRQRVRLPAAGLVLTALADARQHFCSLSFHLECVHITSFLPSEVRTCVFSRLPVSLGTMPG